MTAKAPGTSNKPKASPQAKGIIDESGLAGSAAESSGSSGVSTTAQGALLAEATKLLKNVSIKHLEINPAVGSVDILDELGINKGWLMSAVAHASDPQFALIDSGATNALRPAEGTEIAGAREISVDLASGVTNLHIDRYGTLLSTSPCQVILPAGYLVCLGFSLNWTKKGCVVRRRKGEPLSVTVVRGCPLIPREVGLKLLKEYEDWVDKRSRSVAKTLQEQREAPIPKAHLRAWLIKRVGSGLLTREDQVKWLVSAFPQVPDKILQRVVGDSTTPESLNPQSTPWNRRKRRSIMRAKPGEVLVHLFAGKQRWRGQGMVLEIEKSRGWIHRCGSTC